MRGALPVLSGIGLLPFFWASCGGTVTSSETEWGEPDAATGQDAAKKDASKDGHTDAKEAGKDALPEIRRRICDSCAWLGVELDPDANARKGPRISTTASRVSAWVVPTNEELMIARHTGRVLGLVAARV